MVKSGYTSHYSFWAVGYASSISDLLDTGSTRKGLGEKRTIVAKKKACHDCKSTNYASGPCHNSRGRKRKEKKRKKISQRQAGDGFERILEKKTWQKLSQRFSAASSELGL